MTALLAALDEAGVYVELAWRKRGPSVDVFRNGLQYGTTQPAPERVAWAELHSLGDSFAGAMDSVLFFDRALDDYLMPDAGHGDANTGHGDDLQSSSNVPFVSHGDVIWAGHANVGGTKCDSSLSCAPLSCVSFAMKPEREFELTVMPGCNPNATDPTSAAVYTGVLTFPDEAACHEASCQLGVHIPTQGRGEFRLWSAPYHS